MSTVYDEKLLDKVKLAMIPSAYKGAADENNAGGALGRVYSVLPEQTLGDNLIVNGGFDTSSGWTVNPPAQITGGKLVYDGSAAASISTYRNIGQDLSGKIVKVKLTISDYQGGQCKVAFFGATAVEVLEGSNNLTSNGDFEIILRVGVNHNGNTGVQCQNNFEGSIDDFSVQKYINGDFDFSRGSNATRVNSQGVVQNVEIVSDELIRNGGFDTTLGSELVQNGDFEQIGSELAQNRDFEQLGSNEIDFGDFDSQADVDTWGIASDNSIPRATKSLQDGFMRVTYATNIGAALFVSQSRIPRNKHYKVTFRAKGTANANFVSIGGNNSLNNNPEYVVLNPILATDWQNYEFYVSHGDEPTFRFYLGSAQIGDILDIDDIVVQEVGQNWEFYNDAYISEGKGYIVGDGSSFTHINQTNIFTIGKFYKVTLDAVINSGLGLKVQDGVTNENFGFITTSGTYTFYAKANSTTLTIGRRTGGTAFDSYVDNISVKEVGQNWTTDGNNAWYYNDGKFSGVNGVSGKLLQDNTVFNNKILKVTLTVSNYNGGRVIIDFGSTSADPIEQNGTFTVYGNSDQGSFQVYKNGSFTGNVDNISVQEVQGLNDWSLNDGAFFTGSGIRLKHTPVAGVVTTTFYTPLTVGKNYKMTYEIKEINAGGVKLNTAVDVDLINEVGTHVKYFEAAFNYISLARTDPSNNDVVVDNISVVEVTNDTDIPRLDYSNSACPSLLLEPTRANKLLESENFDRGGSFWNPNNNSVSIEGGYLAPDGTTNAYKITQGSNKAAAILYTGSGDILGTDARSIWAKTTGGTGEVHLCSHNLNTNNLFTVTENWQRFEVLGTTSTAGDTNFYAVDFRAAATNLTEVIIWGAQCEVGGYVTSYIPTRGLSETRNEDFCDNAGDSTIFNSQEGVLFAEIAASHDDLTFRVIGLGDDTNSNIVKFGYRSDSNNIYYEVRDGNVSQSFQMYQVSDITDFHKVAIKFKENDFAMWIDGSEVKTDNTGTVPSGLTMINFDGGNGFSNFLGKVRSLLYFDEALSDAELEYITSADIDLTVHNYKGSLSKISATYEDVGVKDRLTKLF